MAGISQQSSVPTVDLEQVGRIAADLIDHGTWSREQLLAYQQERLQLLLRRAVTHSPYYRETIGELVAEIARLRNFRS